MEGLIPLCPFIKRVQYLGFSTLEKEKELGKTNGTVLNGCLQKESDLENLVFFSSKVFGSSWFWYLVPTLLFGLFFCFSLVQSSSPSLSIVSPQTCTQHKSTQSTHQLLTKSNQI